jgi:hypothetical protein
LRHGKSNLWIRLRLNPTGKSLLIFRNRVNPEIKNIPLSPSNSALGLRPATEGVRHERGRDAVDAAASGARECRRTNDAEAYSQVVSF